MPAPALAAGCTTDPNPAGTTCDTADGAVTLDNLLPAPTYTNRGTINNTVADGVKLDDPNAVFTNNGTFNNNTAAGALNFNQAGGTFINNGVFNSNIASGIRVDGNSTFTNNGTFNDVVTGSFDIVSGDVTFNNNAGATFKAFGGFINLGSGTFNNAGTFDLTGNATVGTQTNITGNFIQTGTGVLRLRTNWGATAADNLNVSGDATLAGKVNVVHTNVTGGTLTNTYTIVNNGGTLDATNLTVTNSAIVTNSLTANANDVQLTSTINFMGAGTQVTGNAAAIAGAVNTAFVGGANLGFVTGLINIPTTAQYVQALQSLGPVADARGAVSTMATSNTFANQLLSCRVPGDGDQYAIIREGQCVWTRITGRRGETGSTDTGPGVSSSSVMISSGAQFKVGGPWRVGGGIAYEEASGNSAIARSDAQRVHLGGVLKYNPGPWLFALGLNGGFGNSDNKRFVSFGGFTSTATSSNDTDYIAGRFTAAYLMQLGGFYVKPQMDIAQTYLSRGGYTESATGGIALTVAGSNLSVWSYTPSIEVGMQTRLANNNLVRPYAKVGGTWQDKDQVSTTAAFNGVAGSTFVMTSSMDRAFLDLGAGLDVIATEGSVLRLQVDGQYGETTTSHSGSAKFSLKF